MKVNRVLTMLMAQDMDRAVRFYKDVVGLHVVFQSPEWSEMSFGDAIVALHGGGDGTYHATDLGFEVADVHAACAEVEQAGGRIVQPAEDRGEEGIWLAMVADTEGNGIMLSSRK